MSEYEEMPREDQITLLEEFAHDVLLQYGISAKSLLCINHAFNTTFKLITVDDKTFAMRINTNSKKWPEHVWAEVQWMQKIANEGEVQVPVPVPNLQGEFFSNHYFFYDGGNLNIVLTNWIEGEVIKERPTENQLFELGKSMAFLHQSGKTWVAQGYANFKEIDTPLMVERANLFTEVDQQVSAELYEMLRDVNLEAVKVLESLRARSAPQLIHADLHFGNIIVHEDTISILDFDDAGMGFPLQDLANAIFYLRADYDKEEHLIAGYMSVAPLPKYQAFELEALIASQALTQLSSRFADSTAENMASLPQYLEVIEEQLNTYRLTGRFSGRPKGM